VQVDGRYDRGFSSGARQMSPSIRSTLAMTTHSLTGGAPVPDTRALGDADPVN
jgi:hypothetical protein